MPTPGLGLLDDLEDLLLAACQPGYGQHEAARFDRIEQDLRDLVEDAESRRAVLPWDTIWDWCNIAAEWHESARRFEIDRVLRPLRIAFSGATRDTPAYRIDLYERNGDPSDVPFAKWVTEELDGAQRAALVAAIQHVLAYEGGAVAASPWGRALGDNLYLFEISVSAADAARMKSGQVPSIYAVPGFHSFLRVFFAVGESGNVVVFDGFDAVTHDSGEYLVEKVRLARAALREIQERRRL